jgi:hypothetical protein
VSEAQPPQGESGRAEARIESREDAKATGGERSSTAGRGWESGIASREDAKATGGERGSTAGREQQDESQTKCTDTRGQRINLVVVPSWWSGWSSSVLVRLPKRGGVAPANASTAARRASSAKIAADVGAVASMNAAAAGDAAASAHKSPFSAADLADRRAEILPRRRGFRAEPFRDRTCFRLVAAAGRDDDPPFRDDKPERLVLLDRARCAAGVCREIVREDDFL